MLNQVSPGKNALIRHVLFPVSVSATRPEYPTVYRQPTHKRSPEPLSL